MPRQRLRLEKLEAESPVTGTAHLHNPLTAILDSKFAYSVAKKPRTLALTGRAVPAAPDFSCLLSQDVPSSRAMKCAESVADLICSLAWDNNRGFRQGRTPPLSPLGVCGLISISRAGDWATEGCDRGQMCHFPHVPSRCGDPCELASQSASWYKIFLDAKLSAFNAGTALALLGQQPTLLGTSLA